MDGTWKSKLTEVLDPWYKKFPVKKGPGSRSSGIFAAGSQAAAAGARDLDDDGGAPEELDFEDFN